eukprot:4767242-Prymnesium_polylepis.1
MLLPDAAMAPPIALVPYAAQSRTCTSISPAAAVSHPSTTHAQLSELEQASTLHVEQAAGASAFKCSAVTPEADTNAIDDKRLGDLLEPGRQIHIFGVGRGILSAQSGKLGAQVGYTGNEPLSRQERRSGRWWWGVRKQHESDAEHVLPCAPGPWRRAPSDPIGARAERRAPSDPIGARGGCPVSVHTLTRL